MSQSSGYCGRLTCRTEWTRARWENAASLVAWSESWLGSLGVTGRLAVPSLKRSSTWWASRVVPHNHCRLDGSPEMGSSSDAARRLALKLQAIYNYPLFLFFFPGGGTSRAGIWGWVCEQQRQACHLTCVGAESLPVLFYPVPAGTTQCLNPFCGHGQTDTVECAWYVSLSVRYLSPFRLGFWFILETTTNPPPVVTELPPLFMNFYSQ